MTELFPDITDTFKSKVECILDLVFRQGTLLKGINALQTFSDTCTSSEKDYINFCLKLRLESLGNESSND